MRSGASQAARDAGLLQFTRDAFRAAAAPFAQARQSFGKLRVIGIDAQADDVQRLPVSGDRDFDPIDRSGWIGYGDLY